ncbi:Protein TIFY 3B [Linum perenne]
MDQSIVSPKLKESADRIIKQERVNDDRRCLKLFGEKVTTRNGDGDGKGSKVISSYHKGLRQFMLRAAHQRRTSILEHQILPGIENGGRERGSGAEGTSQLTIFYAGMVNVFDNIPPEKAEAMILLARGSCAANNKKSVNISDRQPLTMNELLPTTTKLPTSCQLQADQLLPVARKISLQHFMEKRRLSKNRVLQKRMITDMKKKISGRRLFRQLVNESLMNNCMMM